MPKKTYTPMPEVPVEIRERYRVALEVLSGAKTVSDGARALGMSRNHFQSILHRGLGGLLEALQPKPPGPAPRSEREAKLEREAERLRHENTRLQNRVDDTNRLLEVASGFLQGRIKPTHRARRTRAVKKAEAGNEGQEDPDGERKRRLEGAQELRGLGVTAPLAAAVVGASRATISRWRARDRLRQPLAERTGPRRGSSPPRPRDVRAARDLVRETHGLIGAEAIRQAVPILSRRVAARIKQSELREIEKERIANACRVTVTVPGVIRGMDAMHLEEGYLLVAADGAIPYRTRAHRVPRYDGPAVRDLIAADIAEHGAPLVYRLDRAKAHQTPEVLEVLESEGVLLLHGPPHLPRYYGQLERQNRDHRAWLRGVANLDPEDLLRTMNALWPRATLDWLTPLQCWRARPKLEVDRAALREEVQERAARLRPELNRRGATADMAERLAIEKALTKRGYLTQELGGWC